MIISMKREEGLTSLVFYGLHLRQEIDNVTFK